MLMLRSLYSGFGKAHEADIILDFLYLTAKNYTKNYKLENDPNPKEKSNLLKPIKRSEPIAFLD